MRIAQKPQQPGYVRLHQKLLAMNGNATRCSNPECTYKNPKRYEWALVKGRQYSLDINDYMQLCPSCHRRYDYNPKSGAKVSLKKKGIPAVYLMRLIMRISNDDHVIYLGIHKAAQENRITRTGILNCLSGSSSTCGGYKWRYRV